MPERKQEEDGRNRGADERRGQRTCPICGKPSDPKFRPFCSGRCRDVDLHRWLSGRYAIPVEEDADEDGALPEIGSPPVKDDPDRD